MFICSTSTPNDPLPDVADARLSTVDVLGVGVIWLGRAIGWMGRNGDCGLG
ncbi:hypothetical protein RMSM_01222 [Rhodopirellula maiorica SM1]|uniref:Uncharacterized protein n=1 Tax=Rhodopirellula maiorica SM1 TaxID=1265738 RepID=M5S2I4_9BACT|nr:hypothetical protein RMSM_01222 [Rhodopirellula maiorica SM1]